MQKKKSMQQEMSVPCTRGGKSNDPGPPDSACGNGDTAALAGPVVGLVARSI